MRSFAKQWALLALLGMAGAGCFGNLNSAIEVSEVAALPEGTDPCFFAYFKSQVQPVLASKCAACHATASAMVLRDGSQPSESQIVWNYVKAFETLLEDDGGNAMTNPFLDKARGGSGHSGGAVLTEIGDEFTILYNWVEVEHGRLTCTGNGEIDESGGDPEFGP